MSKQNDLPQLVNDPNDYAALVKDARAQVGDDQSSIVVWIMRQAGGKANPARIIEEIGSPAGVSAAMKTAEAELEGIYGFKKISANLWRGDHYWATIKSDGRIRFSVERPATE